MLLTGLRGVGKTVLLDSLKPLAVEKRWIWIGADLNESSSISEENIATRLCTDLSLATSSIVVSTASSHAPGFTSEPTIRERTLTYAELASIYTETPGLPLDKIKTVIETAWNAISGTGTAQGIVFAYDEAQNLSDHAEKERFPLSLVLDAFQSLQRKNLPLMLVLTGLPTLFPKLVEARTFSERMFRSVFLQGLSYSDSREAILKPIEDTQSVTLTDDSVDTVIKMSGGYPYFIQFICKEVYDAFIRRWDKGERGKRSGARDREEAGHRFLFGTMGQGHGPTARAACRNRAPAELRRRVYRPGNRGEITRREGKVVQQQVTPTRCWPHLAPRDWCSRTDTGGTRSRFPCWGTTSGGRARTRGSDSRDITLQAARTGRTVSRLDHRRSTSPSCAASKQEHADPRLARVRAT